MKILKFIVRWLLRLLLFAIVAGLMTLYGVLIRNHFQKIGLNEFMWNLLYVFGIIAVLFFDNVRTRQFIWLGKEMK